MPTPLSPIPDGLGFAFTTSAALASGVSRTRLAHPELVRPAHGTRALHRPATLSEEAAALAVVLEEPFAFSHRTAALLMGLPAPRRWELGQPLEVMMPTPRRPRRPGVIGHRGLERRRIGSVNDVPVVHPADVFVDVATAPARARWSLEDVVALGDALMNWGEPWGEELAEVATAYRGRRGCAHLRAALAMVRPGAESAMESQARVRFVRAGLPEPELNQNIVTDGGLWLARVDMLWRAARVIVEYEGDGHRERRQWRADIERVRRLEAAGYRVVRVTIDDLSDPVRFAALVGLLRVLVAPDASGRAQRQAS